MIQGKQFYSSTITSRLQKVRMPSGVVVNAFKIGHSTLYDLLDSASEVAPEKVFIIDDNGKQYTFSDLKLEADTFASKLANEYEVARGSVVGLLIFNSFEICALFLALNKLGAIAVPLATKLRHEKIQYLVDYAELDCIIYSDKYDDWFGGDSDSQLESISLNSLKDTESSLGQHLIHKTLPYEPETLRFADAAMFMTSGTTGASKKVLLTNFSILQAVESYEVILGTTENDSTVVATPMYYVTGLIAIFLLTLKVRAKMYIHKFFDSERVVKTIEKEGLTFFHASPTVFIKLLEHRSAVSDLSKLHTLICGSAHMPSDKIRELNDWIPNAAFRTVYGMTETSSPFSIMPTAAALSKFIESSGIPIPVNEVRIVNDDDEDLAFNTAGNVLLRGATVITSYFDAQINKDSFTTDGWLRSGDIGYVNEEGYLFIVDRKKDIVNCGGEKVWTYEVEEAIHHYIEGVDEVAVVGVPDEVYGEIVGSLIALRHGYEYSQEKIIELLSPHLAKFQIPRKVMFVDSLPKTENSKIDKKLIKKIIADDYCS